MKTFKHFSKYYSFIFFVLISILLITCHAFAKETKKVAVLPFVMNTQQDLSFLQKGIFDMFSSRLSNGDEVLVLSREELERGLKKADPANAVLKQLNETKSKLLGSMLGVDYVLYGSLTLFGNSMSLDVNMVDVSHARPTLSFFRQSNNAGAVIPELNAISEEINYKIFNRGVVNQHIPQQALAQNDHRGNNALIRDFEPSFRVNSAINSIALGDLDGDGKNEIVIIDEENVIQILKNSGKGRLIPVKKIKDSLPTGTLASVDVGDINQNGYAEIFLTRFNITQQTVISYVIEFNGTQYVIGKKKYPWYFRVLNSPDTKPRLIAQLHDEAGGPWYPKSVFHAVWNGTGYVEGQRFPFPVNKAFCVLSMIDISSFREGAADAYYLYTDRDGAIVVFNGTGKIDWKSDDGYGGSTLSYEIKNDGLEHEDHSNEFFQPKSVVVGSRGAGKAKLFVIQNSEATDYFFADTRVFKKGVIQVFNLDKKGVSFESTPKNLTGKITSIAMGDLDNDYRNELIISMVKSDGLLTSSSRTTLLVTDLE